MGRIDQFIVVCLAIQPLSVTCSVIHMTYIWKAERQWVFYQLRPLISTQGQVAPCKGIQDNSEFQAMDSRFFVSGTWISDSNREWIHSGFLELYSGFHSPGFRIPQQQFQVLDSGFHKKKISGFLYLGRASAQYTTLKRPIMYIEGDRIASICIILYSIRKHSVVAETSFIHSKYILSCRAAYLQEVRASLLYGQVACNSQRLIYLSFNMAPRI